ncbi:MAG: D-glycero-beta-D-manno-heptose-7-phosphate kinase [Proteobacteria bacterium]|nr:D-glycero-beta-D-manno-heptose-7-phosphate kinase [Pseudomonadota bacterium]
MTKNKANQILKKFSDVRVLIIGDLIMDHFIWGNVNRISPEAPVPVVDVTSENLLLGGSANVANNINSLGGRSIVSGIVGRDNDGQALIDMLKKMKIRTRSIVVDDVRPTTIKTRVIAHNQQVVRFDREAKFKINGSVLKKVVADIKKSISSVDAVIISDYAKGLISKDLVEEIVIQAKRYGIPIAVDPKVSHFDFYKDVNIVTPNNFEASMASGIDICDEDSLSVAGDLLSAKLGCEALLVTRGEHGMNLFEDKASTHIPTVAKEVYDVSGAGDTVIAVIGLALGSGATYKEAAVLANFAAGIVVGKVGTASVSIDELKDAVKKGLG